LLALASLIHNPDQEVIIDALWALSYLSDGNDSQIQAVVNAGILPRVISLLEHALHTVQTPALRTVGNIVTGNDTQTQAVLNENVLSRVYSLLQSPRKGIKKEAAWTISNITAGNKQQTQQVITANIMPQLITLMLSSEFDVKKEATWAISNATTWQSYDQINYLVSAGICHPLCELMKTKDSKLLAVVLEAVDNILATGNAVTKGQSANPFCLHFEEHDGIDRLEELQNHESEDIYQKAVKILEKYFSAEEEDENLVPNVSTYNGTQTFNFGTNQIPSGGFIF